MTATKKNFSLPSDIIKKSNAIARARWQPKSVWEARIVALVASKVRMDDEDFLTYRVSVTELTGVSDENLGGDQYREIKESILHLSKATILIQGKNPRNFMSYPIFAKCGYEDGDLIAGFHPDLKPHFLSLKEHFTEYSLVQFLLLPSTYSQRIFEFLKSWSGLPEIITPVSELHESLNTPPSFRADFRAFRTRVLEKAKKDITEKTSFWFDWEPIKAGRTVVKIRFIFSNKRALLSEQKNVMADVKKENALRLANKRFFAAVECAKAKNGQCLDQTNRPIICKVCKKLDVCASVLTSSPRLKSTACQKGG